MSSAKHSSVDDVWRQLNAGTCKQQNKANFDKLWYGFNNDSLRKPSSTTSTAHASSNAVGTAKHLVQAAKSSQAGQLAELHSSNRTVKDSLNTVDSNHNSLQRSLQLIQDPGTAVRKQALRTLKMCIMEQKSIPEADMCDLLEGDVGKALLKRFDDKVESCRETAVSIYCYMMQACPDAILAVLPYAIPVLEERLHYAHGKGPTEPCEEIRLQLMNLLHNIVQFAGQAIAAYAAEAIAMMTSGFQDSFYEVNIEACDVVVCLNSVLGAKLHPVSKQLVADVLPLTTHNRYKVRVAAIKAVRVTMFQNAHEMILEMVAFRDPNVVPVKAFYGDDLKVNFCGKLSTDTNPQVRLEFLDMVGDWLLNLPERLDHEQRLLPYILSALSDPHPPIADAGVKLLEALGQLHVKDKGKELEDTLRYLPEEAHGLGWGISGIATFVYGSVEKSADASNTAGAPFVMPAPFKERPPLGARLVVQGNFGRSCNALCAELQGWMHGLQLRAAQLLRSSLVYLEDHVTNHLHLLLPALTKAVSDAEVGPVVVGCLNIIGCFVQPRTWLAILLPRIEDPLTDMPARACHLLAIAALIRGVAPVVADQLKNVANAVLLPTNLKTEDTAVKGALEQLLQALLSHHTALCGEVQQALVLALLYVRSSTKAGKEQQERLEAHTERMLVELAGVVSAGSVDCLLAQHREGVIVQVSSSDSWLSGIDLLAVSRLIVPGSCAPSLHTPLATTTTSEDSMPSPQVLPWSPTTLTQLLQLIQKAVQTIPAAPATATILHALDICLHHLPPDTLSTCSQHLTSLLEATCSQLPNMPHGNAAVLALRCLSTACQRQLLSSAALEQEAEQLSQCTCLCMAGDTRELREQACHTMMQMLNSVSSCSIILGSAPSGNSAAENYPHHLPLVPEAALTRCYDSNEHLQVLAVHLLNKMLVMLSCKAGSPASGGGTCAEAGPEIRLARVIVHRVQSSYGQWAEGPVQAEVHQLLAQWPNLVQMKDLYSCKV